jgi:hypothetical protein
MSMDDELSRLEKRHPRFEELKTQWAEIDDVLFDGIQHNKSTYLVQGESEEDGDYQMRLQMARFKGEVATYLEGLVGAVFESPPSRPEALTNKHSEILDDVDGTKTPIDQFMQDRLFNALGFGLDGILVDLHSQEDSEEYTSMGFKPVPVETTPQSDRVVFVPYKAFQIVDWNLDKHGEFNWVRLYEENVVIHDDIEAKADAVDIYREYDRSSWRVFHVTSDKAANNKTVRKAELVAEGDHNLGMVPLVILGINGSKMSYQSPIRYIYHYDIDMFTDWGDLRWDTWRHAHPTLVDYTMEEGSHSFPIGPNAKIKRSPAHNEKAEYLAYPTAASDQLRMNIASGIEGIRRLGGRDPIGGSDNPSALGASGRAREVAHATGEARFLRKYAKAASNAEMRLFELVERWKSGKPNPHISEKLNPYVTSYPDDFTMEPAETLIDLWLGTRGEINSEAYDRAMQRKIISRLLGDVGAEERERILKEIETNPLLKSALTNPLDGGDGIDLDAFQEMTESDLNDDEEDESKDEGRDEAEE